MAAAKRMAPGTENSVLTTARHLNCGAPSLAINTAGFNSLIKRQKPLLILIRAMPEVKNMPDTVQTTNLPTGRTNWTNLVDRIQHGETSGMEELYHLFAKGIRFMLCRRLGQVEADDRLHDTFLIVTAAIKRGELREPERLMGFVRTVVVRQIAAYIQIAIQKRRDERDFDLLAKTIPDRGRNAEQTFAFLERVDFMKTVLGELSERDREILSLFYLKEQTQEQICAHMNLTDTQFRLLKSRAKSRFAELGKRRLLRPRLLSAFAVSA